MLRGSFFNDFWLPMVPWFDKTLGPKQLEHRPPADALIWNFANFEPDVFVLALGTNDFSEQYPHIDAATYIEKYKAFLGQLRGYYPNAELFCLAPFKEGAPWDEARRYISLAVQALGDSHAHAVDPVGSTLADRWLTYPTDYVTGDEYHPNLIGHQKIARTLADIIRPIMGW